MIAPIKTISVKMLDISSIIPERLYYVILSRIISETSP